MGQAKGLIADDAGGGLNNSGSSGIYAVQALLQIPAATRDRNSAPRGDGLSTHHDESISAASASAKMSRSGPAGLPAPTHSVQIGLANLWQATVAGPSAYDRLGTYPA
jgi:hypothetical protein